MAKYFYSCCFINKPINLYTYESSIKFEENDLAVVPSNWGCGFSIVQIKKRLLKKEVSYQGNLTKIVCRLKKEVDDKPIKYHYICAVDGNMNKTEIVSSSQKLHLGDIIYANLTSQKLLAVMQETRLEKEPPCKLIQKINLTKYENSFDVKF